jgi:hypothetical protein
MEQNNFRDEHGRLRPGHSGLKPKGAANMLQSEIKSKITDFVAGEIESIGAIYCEVSSKDKLRFLTELIAYILPKSKEIITDPGLKSTRFTQADLQRLSDDEIRTLLYLQRKLYGTETSENSISKS